MRAAHRYDESDTQGPWVVLCEACIESERHEPVPDDDWIEGDDWRCACCGSSDSDDWAVLPGGTP